jgi:hypothetical protein
MVNKESKNNGGGIVYILINQAMPGYVKIGKTKTSVEQRILELSRSSAVPIPFECYYAAEVLDVNKVESAFHDAFGDHRKNPKREFFTIAPERVVAVLSLLSVKEMTPQRNVGVESKEDAIAIEEARKKRLSFNFRMVNIPADSELKFIRNENISCIVAPDQKHVIFNDKKMSSSEAAALVLKSKWWPQGPGYWIYEGETLDERRMRMEEDSESVQEEIETTQ